MPVDTLTTKLVLEAEQYAVGSKRATAGTLALANAQDKATTAAKKHQQAVDASAKVNAHDGSTVDALAKKYGALGRAVQNAQAAIQKNQNSPAHFRGLVAGAAGSAKNALGGINVGNVGQIGTALAGLEEGATAVAGYAAAAAAIPVALAAGEKALFDAAQGPAKAAAEWDALTASLNAVEGSSKKAGVELKRLMTLAAAPGLGQEEAIRGYTSLRNSGLEQGLSERLIKEFANANAKAGGGPAEFARIIAQVSQTASKPFLQGEELSTLTENGIPAYKIVKDALGTSDTEELKKRGITSVQVLEAIAASLEKTSRVAGSSKNSFDNLFDTLDAGQRSVGQGVNESWGPLADKITEAVAAADKGGIFKELGESITDALNLDDVNVDETLANIVAFAKTAVFFFGKLKDSILAALGPIAKLIGFVLDQGALGPVIDSVGDVFNANKDAALQSIKDGRRLTEAEKKKADKAAQDAKEFRRPDGTIDKQAKDAAEAAAKAAAKKDPASQAPNSVPGASPNSKEGADGVWRLPDGTVDTRATEEARRRKLAALSGQGAGATGSTPAEAKQDKQTRLLERIAVSNERIADGIDDATSGGGSLARSALGAQQLSSVVGGFNRRFRAMGGH